MTVLSHTKLAFAVPPGTGARIPVQVEIDSTGGGGDDDDEMYESNKLHFAYDPPYISYISPNTPDAEGDTLSIYGSNFGATESDAGGISVQVGGLACTGVTASDDDGASQASMWQKKSSTVYLWCTTGRLRVGTQAVTVSVGGQNSSWDAEDGVLTTQCEYGYYGQEAWTVLTTAADPTCQECSETQVECMRYYNGA